MRWRPPRRQPPPGRGPWLKIALLALFVGGVVAFFALGGQHYLTLETIKANRDALLRFTEAHFAAALAIALPHLRRRGRVQPARRA